jgi:acyl-CoA synthetase (AMP-forming)/AMP-acid ligase II
VGWQDRAVPATSRLTLAELVSQHARSWPGGRAVADGDVHLTWSALDDRAARLASALAGLGVAPGDRVLWLGQNSFRIQELLVACARMGAFLCPANWRGTAEEQAFAIDDLRPRVVVWQHEEVGEVGTAARARAAHDDAMWIAHDAGEYEALIEAAEPGAIVDEVGPDDPLLLVYTAAFAGRPHAAMLSHRALIAQGMLLADYTGAGPDDVYLCSGPLFHVGTFMFALAALVTGGTNVFVRRNDGEAICRAIAAEGCTGGYIVGPMIDGVVEANREGRFDLSTFRGHRGHPEFDAMVQPDRSRWGRRAGGWGQTELVGMATFTLLAPDGIGVHGRPSPLLAVRVVGPDGDDLPVGETGELVARGVTVMNGYWDRPEENARRSVGGWHHTGDLGRYEVDGTLTFVGPAGRMLKTGAENVYPAEVEACLRGHPAVIDAAVIGIPDPTWVQSVMAVIVVRDPITADEVVEHCRTHLASYKKPRTVEFVDALPHLPTGPVDYDALDQRFGGGNYPGGTTPSV